MTPPATPDDLRSDTGEGDGWSSRQEPRARSGRIVTKVWVLLAPEKEGQNRIWTEEGLWQSSNKEAEGLAIR